MFLSKRYALVAMTVALLFVVSTAKKDRKFEKLVEVIESASRRRLSGNSSCVGWTRSSEKCVVSVADLHGDYRNMVEVLKKAGVIHDKINWRRKLSHYKKPLWNLGKATFVQTGDIFSRGNDARKMLDLMMRLQREAEGQGGKVHQLLGNHDMQNLLDMDEWWHWDLDASGRSKFIPDEEINTWWPNADFKTVRGFNKAWKERHRALGKTGTYGKYLRNAKAAVVVGGTLYCHAGMKSHLAKMGVDRINSLTKSFLMGKKSALAILRDILEQTEDNVVWRLRNHGIYTEKKQKPFLEAWEIFSRKDGIFWTRGFQVDAADCPTLNSTLKDIGVERMVIGHNVTSKDDRIKCDGKLFSMDSGISSYYGSGLSSLTVMSGNPKIQD